MPQETKVKPELDATDRAPSLQGLVATCGDEGGLRRAMEKAFDYRGDVTLTLTDGTRIVGYVFDRIPGESLSSSTVRLLTAASDDPVKVAFNTIAQIEFTGRDTAAGKSFETWIRKYTEKKLAGEEASIHSESLDGE